MNCSLFITNNFNFFAKYFAKNKARLTFWSNFFFSKRNLRKLFLRARYLVDSASIICFCQRLSHACLSINSSMMKLRTAQYNSYNLFDERDDKDIFENVKANTCRWVHKLIMSELSFRQFNHGKVIKWILGPIITISFWIRVEDFSEIIVWNESFIQVIIKNIWPINYCW